MADIWKKIKAEYIRDSKSSYRKLAAKYGVSFSALRRKAENEKWTDLRTQREHKANTKLVERASEIEADHAEAILDIADELLEQIKRGIADGSLIKNAKDMRSLTGAIRDLKDIKGIRSDLDAQEQKARIDKLRREAAKDDKSDGNQYGVFIMPPVMEVPKDD